MSIDNTTGIDRVQQHIGEIASRCRTLDRLLQSCESFTTVYTQSAEEAERATSSSRATRATQGQYGELVARAAAAHNLPPQLLAAVMQVESGGNASAVSPAGALGLMQLMPATAAGLGVNDPFDPAQNILGGAAYLRQQLDRFGGDVRKALAAYNAGPGAVKRFNGIPPYPETQRYVDKVLGIAGAINRDDAE